MINVTIPCPNPNGSVKNVTMHVSDLIKSARQNGLPGAQGNYHVYHIMPADENASPEDQKRAMEQIDKDPVAFWNQVKQQQPDFDLPPQLLDPQASWIQEYQQQAQSEMQFVSNLHPVCRVIPVGKLEIPGQPDMQLTVKPATINHSSVAARR